ncbi:MAG: flagellar basal body protein [Candidatus Margulisiibacteriota bacterium]
MVEEINIFGSQIGNLEQAMEISARRQEIISQNIANAKTPGYEALTFDEQLMRAVKRTDKKQVVLEEELAALTDNSIKYSAYVKMFSARTNILRTIATQGKR